MRIHPGLNARLEPCLAGAITASANGRSIDALGCEAVSFKYRYGTTTSGTSGTVAFKLETSDDNTNWSAISGATIAAAVPDSDALGNKHVLISISRRTVSFGRYVRAVITITGTASTAATGPQNAGGVLAAGPISRTLKTSDFDSATVL